MVLVDDTAGSPTVDIAQNNWLSADGVNWGERMVMTTLTPVPSDKGRSFLVPDIYLSPALQDGDTFTILVWVYGIPGKPVDTLRLTLTVVIDGSS